VVADLARDLGVTFMHGLSDRGRTRIRIARPGSAPIAPRCAAARSGGREAGRLIEDHPLIAAALAFAVAAALAAILPRAAARGHAPRAEDPADEDPDADDLAPEDFEPDDDTGAAGDAEALMAEAEELERRARRDERRQAAARPQPADREDDLPPAETA
jgi:hypothetical protein